MIQWIRFRAAGVRRFHARDIILVYVLDHPQEIQPFYRSSGKNSFRPGVWFPFDGLRADGWFDKGRFANHVTGDALYRFGEEKYREISDELDKYSIGPGLESSVDEINDWIAYWKNDLAYCLGDRV